MNIIVRPYGRSIHECRPDTTWERENKDYYVPDCVDEIHWAPIVFARISKAGKCIGGKFASRYYDALGFGALMYCHHGEFITSCADHTSLLPFPLYNPIVLENEKNAYIVTKDGETIFDNSISHDRNDLKGEKEKLEEAICQASVLTSLRIGDFVAVELAPVVRLASRAEGTASFKATFCENDLYDLKIIF